MPISKNEAGLFETQIEEHTYEFEKWGAESALNTLFDLSLVAGKPIGALAASGAGLNTELTPPTVDTLITALTDNLRNNREVVMGMVRKMASQKLFCDGKPIGSFDLHYKDRLQHLFLVVRANMEVQYGNFFSDMKAIGRAADPKAKTKTRKLAEA